MWEVTLKQLKQCCVRLNIKDDSSRAISLPDIAEQYGLDAALCCTRYIPNIERDIRLYAAWCARNVQHIATNDKSEESISVAEKYANGDASADELFSAHYEAICEASYSSWSGALYAAASASYRISREAAREAAQYAMRGKNYDEMNDDIEAAQKAMFIKMCRGEAPWQQQKGNEQ